MLCNISMCIQYTFNVYSMSDWLTDCLPIVYVYVRIMILTHFHTQILEMLSHLKIMFWDQSLRLQVLRSQNSIFLVLGLDTRTRYCYLWDQMLSSNTISSPCRELMGLQPMLLPKLTQNKEVFLPSNPRGKNLGFWD